MTVQMEGYINWKERIIEECKNLEAHINKLAIEIESLSNRVDWIKDVLQPHLLED